MKKSKETLQGKNDQQRKWLIQVECVQTGFNVLADQILSNPGQFRQLCESMCEYQGKFKGLSAQLSGMRGKKNVESHSRLGSTG